MSNKKAIANLSVFTLVMITVGSVDSIRNLPATALFGSSLIFFFTLAAIFFLIPSALVSAELASGWVDEGGIYVWVKAAFGDRLGFMAVWFQWVENVIWYPTILSFVAGTLAYLINPQLAQDKYFLILVIFIAFWFATLLNLRGMRTSAWFSNLCAIFGLLIPMTMIIVLGIVWMYLHKPLQISFAEHALMPNFHESNMWVSLTGIALSFCGMEIATVHARDVRDPQTAFPKALFYSTIIILLTFILGSLAIAIVIPHDKISLVAGLMEAYTVFFNAYHMHWILPLVAVMLVIGGMGGVNNWLIAPIRGLLIAGQEGNLPTYLSRENKHGAPVALLLGQAIIVSLLALVFLLLPSVNASYWLLTALASQLYMIMYVLMFVAGIYLRFKVPDQKRSFNIPGGKLGMCIVGGAGLLGSIIVFIVGFFPPSGMKIGSLGHYEFLLILGLVIMSAPPFLMKFKRAS